MNLLIFGDIHITEKDLPEIQKIFDELLIIKDKHCINKIILTGDTFDKVNPTPKELDCFANFVKKVNIPIISLVAKSHESITPEENVLSHFGILNDRIQIVSSYEDSTNLFVGHFTLKESKMHYGSSISKKEFEKYKYVILGHQHSFELLPKNICHIGSIRYIDFAESQDEHKNVAICFNYKESSERWQFLTLSSPYSMQDIVLQKLDEISAIARADIPKKVPGKSKGDAFLGVFNRISELTGYLDSFGENSKIRVIFKDYELWKDFRPFTERYKNKFFLYKEKKDFEINSNKLSTNTQHSFKNSLQKYLQANKINKEIQTILLEELQ